METVTLKVSETEEESFIIVDQTEIEKNEEEVADATINITDIKDGDNDEK